MMIWNYRPAAGLFFFFYVEKWQIYAYIYKYIYILLRLVIDEEIETRVVAKEHHGTIGAESHWGLLARSWNMLVKYVS